MMKPQNFLLCFGGTNIIHFSLIVSIATSRYEFTDVPQNLVGQSIDSLSFGQFDLLKSKIYVLINLNCMWDMDLLISLAVCWK